MSSSERLAASALFGARLLMRLHGVSPTVSTTLSNSGPRSLVCRSPFVMSSPHDVRALSRPRSQQRTLYPTVRRDAPRWARQGMRIQELHASSASGSSTKSSGFILRQGRRDFGGQRHLRDVQRTRHQAVVAHGTDVIDDAAFAD